MSWDAYVKDQLLAHGLTHGAIIDSSAGGVWAQGPDAWIKGTEGAALVRNFADSASAQGNGIHAGGVKYMCIKSSPESVYGKKGAGGIVCAKCTKCIVIGVYGEALQPGAATTVVEKLADYLKENGY